jgi:hypothetical protein
VEGTEDAISSKVRRNRRTVRLITCVLNRQTYLRVLSRNASLWSRIFLCSVGVRRARRRLYMAARACAGSFLFCRDALRRVRVLEPNGVQPVWLLMNRGKRANPKYTKASQDGTDAGQINLITNMRTNGSTKSSA